VHNLITFPRLEVPYFQSIAFKRGRYLGTQLFTAYILLSCGYQSGAASKCLVKPGPSTDHGFLSDLFKKLSQRTNKNKYLHYNGEIIVQKLWLALTWGRAEPGSRWKTGNINAL